MKYRLHKIIPLRFSSVYGSYDEPLWEGQPPRNATPDRIMSSTWWAWRDRIWFHKQKVVAG